MPLETIWEFAKIRGTLFRGPYHKDPTIQGTILGSPIFGKLTYGPQPPMPCVPYT